MATILGKEISRVYTGKAGCMCGCRGKYSSKPAVIAKVVSNMKKFPLDQMGEDTGVDFYVNYETPGGTRRTLVAYYDGRRE